MSKRAEAKAMEAYPIHGEWVGNQYGGWDSDINSQKREVYEEGYEQAEKDLAPAFEFPFDVPDNDGFIVFTPMDNQTIRRKLKLKKGERVIFSIRKEHEKE